MLRWAICTACDTVIHDEHDELPCPACGGDLTLVEEVA